MILGRVGKAWKGGGSKGRRVPKGGKAWILAVNYRPKVQPMHGHGARASTLLSGKLDHRNPEFPGTLLVNQPVRHLGTNRWAQGCCVSAFACCVKKRGKLKSIGVKALG